MDFIFNSRSKKVEIFYESAEEQQAVLEFVSRFLTYREDRTSGDICINNPGISWTSSTINTIPLTNNASDRIELELNPPYSITTTDTLN